MKRSFVLFTDKFSAIKLLTMEQRGALLTAIYANAAGEDLPPMDDMTRMLYTIIQEGIDYCSEQYEETCKRHREAGRKGGLAKASKAKQSLAKASKAKHNDTDTDTETETDTPKGVKKAGKPAKHKHGEYQHVMLSDDEYQRLSDELGEEMLGKCIRKLDEYIEEKGYKAKSHYLSIKRWVIDAVREHRKKDGGIDWDSV